VEKAALIECRSEFLTASAPIAPKATHERLTSATGIDLLYLPDQFGGAGLEIDRLAGCPKHLTGNGGPGITAIPAFSVARFALRSP
jgi:hypothetical protein